MSDQAEGLRKLFVRDPIRLISFLSAVPQVGKTSLIANLAVCFARAGKGVLLIDEMSGANDLAAAFGLSASYDFWDVLSEGRPIEDVLVSPTPGVQILPARIAIQRIGELNARGRHAWLEAIQSLQGSVSMVLVDADQRHPLGFSPLGLSSAERYLVLSEAPHHVTASYAFIKSLTKAFSRRPYCLVVNKARSRQKSASIQANLVALAAEQQTGSLIRGGCIPLDTFWKKAAEHRLPVVTAYPEAPAALAIREIATDIAHVDRETASYPCLTHLLEQIFRMTERLHSPVFA